MRGRPVDSTEGVPLDGETTALFISRLNLFADAIQEMKSKNQFNLRFPFMLRMRRILVVFEFDCEGNPRAPID